MAYSSRTRVATISLVIMLAGLAACGHFSIELLPGTDDGLDAGGEIDSGDVDASISADGSTDARLDGGGDAGVCQGPKCPGLYVAGEGGVGNDTNPGTSDKPLATIAKGIEIATARGVPTDVYIAAKTNGGKYGEKLDITEGVNLYGGYECTVLPCSWARDVKNNATMVFGTDFRGIVVGDTITRATVLDGLMVFGRSGAPDLGVGAVALTIEGGSPTVRNCKLEGANVNGGVAGIRRSIGVAILGPPGKDPLGPLLEGNTIRSGTSTEESFGVLITTRSAAPLNSTATATIIGDNNIRSGNGVTSVGIVARATSPSLLIADNAISAGASTGGNVGSWAITITRGGSIERNRINLDTVPGATSGPSCTGNVFCGGVRSEGSSAIIRSNIIRGASAQKSAAVLIGVAEGPLGPVSVNGNTLDGVGNGSDNTSISTAVALRNTSGNSATGGKVKNNILLGGVNAFRYGVYEEGESNETIHLVALDNNDFWNPGLASVTNDFAYHSWDGAAGKDYLFASLVTVTTPVPSANKGDDPLLDNTFHLKVGSPMIDKGTTSEAPPHDIDNEGRPKGNGIDIGADESK